jgi:NADPH:quinone reductase-like Zn-dependent oxidoreductase
MRSTSAQVLRVEDDPSPALGPDQVRVRLSYAPIHPGDLLGIMGSPAFGTPPTIASGGRVPGFEGAGVVAEVGARIDPGLGLTQGLRVAFSPAPGSWSDEVVIPAGSVVPLPDSIPDEIGAQMLINTITALTVIRTAHDSLPLDVRTGVVVLLTGAGSAVGRLLPYPISTFCFEEDRPLSVEEPPKPPGHELFADFCHFFGSTFSPLYRFHAQRIIPANEATRNPFANV